MSRRTQHGKEKQSCASFDRANAHLRANPLWFLWFPDHGGVPHAANDYDVAGKLSAYPARAPVSQSSMRVVSSRLSARRGGKMGVTPRRVRAGCDCAGGVAALCLPSE